MGVVFILFWHGPPNHQLTEPALHIRDTCDIKAPGTPEAHQVQKFCKGGMLIHSYNHSRLANHT